MYIIMYIDTDRNMPKRARSSAKKHYNRLLLIFPCYHKISLKIYLKHLWLLEIRSNN